MEMQTNNRIEMQNSSKYGTTAKQSAIRAMRRYHYVFSFFFIQDFKVAVLFVMSEVWKFVVSELGSVGKCRCRRDVL